MSARSGALENLAKGISEDGTHQPPFWLGLYVALECTGDGVVIFVALILPCLAFAQPSNGFLAASPWTREHATVKL